MIQDLNTNNNDITVNFLSDENFSCILTKLTSIKNSIMNYNNDKIVIAFCGGFSSGKSSLINCLLENVFSLPCGIIPTTKIVTRLEYGYKIAAYYEMENKKFPIKRDDLFEIIMGKSLLPSNIKEIVIEIPVPLLSKNVVILDTPGFCNDTRLDNIAFDAEAEADMIFFCCNAETIGKKFDFEHIEELAGNNINFDIIINRMDIVSNKCEINRIKSYMEEKVNKRCNIFYTVADTNKLELDGLVEYIEDICDPNNTKDTVNLKEYIQKRHRFNILNRMEEKISELITFGNVLCANLAKESIEKRDKSLQDYQEKKEKISKLLPETRKIITERLNDTIQSIDSELDRLETKEMSQNFSVLAKQYMEEYIPKIAVSLHEKFEYNQTLLTYQEFKNFILKINNVLDDYEVPQPEGNWIKKRDIMGQVQQSVINIISGVGELDSGYDLEYHGYAETAKIHYKKYLLPAIMHEIDEYLSCLENFVTMIDQISPQDEMTKKALNALRRWRKLLDEVEFTRSLLQKEKIKV